MLRSPALVCLSGRPVLELAAIDGLAARAVVLAEVACARTLVW